ncbi:PHD finger protein 20-like protein 1 [Myzus persicae]|uniref:PHD finger protein 20-like protein 1 n=1 Tax=Myzus persicae TaxID=13164 RepID=UPI000B934743|nr:PHD finger protein 20-like protein 1 [Myzus persicae]
MDFDIGTELLIQSPGNIWTPAFVEEDDGDEIFISYKEGNGANEWINKDSHRIKPMDKEWDAKLINIPTLSENRIPEIKTIIVNVPPSEKEILKKPTTSARSSSIFKVKFKKDDFLTKKTQDSKHKEQKIIKDAKKSSDRESKQLLLCGTPSNEKLSTSTTLKHSHIVEKSGMEVIKESINSSKTPNHLIETNLLRSENFEELLEDIEAEAEICSPTKSISRSDIKQKKKKKRPFGLKRRSDKKRSKLRRSESKKKKIVVKLNSNNNKIKVSSTMPDNTTLSYTDDTALSPPLKKMKPSLPESSLQETPIHQSCSPLFQELANNTLLQKIRMDASDEQGLRCPKQECRKLFRKENLLMMHIKHYHSEYTELLVSTPNVTDLATARIEGENIDELSPSYFLHRISQLEAKRSWGGNTSYETPSPSVISSSLKLTEQEIGSNTTLNSENYNTSFISNDQTNNTTQAYDSKDSGFSGIVESFNSTTETPIKEYAQIKEAIRNITLIDDFENETRDSYDMISIGGSDRHFKIKKNKSDVETLPKEEVINCSCASNQEEGLMIQCDICLCWQHGYCNKINSEDQVPDNYICTSCLNPSKKRRSKQYDYSQDWIKEGTLASVLQHKDERRRKDEAILKQSHQLVAEVIEHNNYLHSLRVKTTIYGQTPDHPKLYLWSEQGLTRNEEPVQDKLEELLSGPVPEKPIDISDCRKNLLDEIEDGFDNLEARINLFEAKTNGLEDQVNGCVDNEVLTNTVTLLLRDLNSINRHMSFENNNNKKEEETV